MQPTLIFCILATLVGSALSEKSCCSIEEIAWGNDDKCYCGAEAQKIFDCQNGFKGEGAEAALKYISECAIKTKAKAVPGCDSGCEKIAK